MKFSPIQFRLIQSLLLPKIDELREAVKAEQDEDKKWELEHQLAIALNTAGTIEGYYLNQ
jgi:hypothetical protein